MRSLICTHKELGVPFIMKCEEGQEEETYRSLMHPPSPPPHLSREVGQTSIDQFFFAQMKELDGSDNDYVNPSRPTFSLSTAIKGAGEYMKLGVRILQTHLRAGLVKSVGRPSVECVLR